MMPRKLDYTLNNLIDSNDGLLKDEGMEMVGCLKVYSFVILLN